MNRRTGNKDIVVQVATAPVREKKDGHWNTYIKRVNVEDIAKVVL